MIGITFNGKHSYDDFGLEQISFVSLPPNKKKIKESVPFMNGTYDFSTVGSNGEATYTERGLQGEYFLKADNKEQLYIRYTNILNWLMDSGKARLESDKEADIYYMAEVENAPDFNEVLKYGTLTIEWIADYCKTGKSIEGQNYWDYFNFETDYLQETEFDVIGSQVVTLYNPGRTISPTVNCDSSMTAINNDYTANFISGDNNDWLFKLQPGLNNITVTGTGHIKFIFRKELL